MAQSLQMKVLVQQIKGHPHYHKAIHWGKLISVTGLAQIIVQAVGFLSGILIIRLLPVEEYALYTLANTMLGTMTVLADGGISAGVMAQGGQVWQDKEKLGTVLATGLDLRRKFAIFSLIVSVPILVYLMLQHGASWLMAGMITLSLIPAFYAALSDSLLEIVPKLHQAITPLQKNQVNVGIGRLFLNAALLFVFPWTAVALIANGLPRMYGNYRLRHISKPYVDIHQKPDPVVRKEILKIVKRVMPGAIYYALSGQISIWLISLFGQTAAVAQLGALGRFSALLTLFSVLFSTLIVPRFARLSERKSVLLNRFLAVLLVAAATLFIFLIFCYLFSTQIIFVLGRQYQGLEIDFVLSILGSCINVLAGLSFTLSSGRGWVLRPIFSISISLISIVIGLLIFDISALRSVLNYNIYLATVQFIMNSSFCYLKISNTK